MTKPTLTPFQANKKLLVDKDGHFTHDGWNYYFDSIQGSTDPKDLFPVAEKDGQEFFPSGDMNDKITEGTYWIE